MTMVGISMFIINGFLAMFAFNVVVKEKKWDFIMLGVGYFIIAVLGVYYFMEEYLIEAIFSLVVFGTPGVFIDNTLPKFIKNNVNMLKILVFIPAISLILIIIL